MVLRIKCITPGVVWSVRKSEQLFNLLTGSCVCTDYQSLYTFPSFAMPKTMKPWRNQQLRLLSACFPVSLKEVKKRKPCKRALDTTSFSLHRGCTCCRSYIYPWREFPEILVTAPFCSPVCLLLLQSLQAEMEWFLAVACSLIPIICKNVALLWYYLLLKCSKFTKCQVS